MEISMRERPTAGEFYRHFKGKLYQVKMIARDSETQQEMVVYQAMYAPFAYWVRPLADFLSEVDHKKYPDVTQKLRFRKVEFQKTKEDADIITEDVQDKKDDRQVLPQTEKKPLTGQEALSDAEMVKALESGQPERYLQGKMSEEDIAQRGLLLLLDAPTFREKRQIFIGLKQYLDERMLNNIAVALDIVLEDGSMEEQYESIMRCLEAFEHYEGGRLR